VVDFYALLLVNADPGNGILNVGEVNNGNKSEGRPKNGTEERIGQEIPGPEREGARDASDAVLG
jgi:hypothetical protein